MSGVVGCSWWAAEGGKRGVGCVHFFLGVVGVGLGGGFASSSGCGLRVWACVLQSGVRKRMIHLGGCEY